MHCITAHLCWRGGLQKQAQRVRAAGGDPDAVPQVPSGTLPSSFVRDEGAAWSALSRAAGQGHQEAQVLLGNLHLARDPPDAESAIQWYEEASTKPDDHPPHPDALFNLGQLYYNGVFAWAATTVAGCDGNYYCGV